MGDRPSALVDTRVIYCGDNLDKLNDFPDDCVDLVGRPDIDSFEAAMIREKRNKGFFIAFDYTDPTLTEIDRFFRDTGNVIVPLTVKEILEEQIARTLA